MDKIYLILLLSWPVSSKITEIKVRENGAANFYLPAAEDCGPYNLSGPDKSVVLRVSPDADTTISRLYSNRSTANVLENGTIVFTLHYITWRDKGAFLTQSLKRNPDCLWHGTITILEDDSRVAFWEDWSSWSICGSSCGPGTRIRTRECNIQGRCHGSSEEEDSCNAKFDCPYWRPWGSWSSCSVSCGRGTVSRRRHCHSDVGECVGESSQTEACAMPQCPRKSDWSTWSDWSSCSLSCGPGTSSRYRQCLVGGETVDNSLCSGEATEYLPCTMGPCELTTVPRREANYYFWSHWYSWSTCSTSCGRGIQTRMRGCLFRDSQRRVQDEYCGGNSEQVQECSQLQCIAMADRTDASTISSVVKTTMALAEGPTETSVDAEKDEAPVPYTFIVGGAAAGFITILLIVIIVLLVRIKKRKDTTVVRRRTIYDIANRQSRQVNSRASRVKSNGCISEMYAEIDDDFIDSEFDATSCNDYGPLPTPVSPHGTCERVKYSVTDQSTGEGNIFVFDGSALTTATQHRVPKISFGSTSRQDNVGGDGYEKPITRLDRQRKMAYDNVEYSNVIR